jgi:AraC family transcriptional regulator, activator of mtrCDE
MDPVSQFLTLAGLRAILDVRCRFGGKFDVDHESLRAGEAAFHLLLSGRCRLRLGDGRELRLKAGDFVLLTRGAAHAIIDDGASEVAALPIETHSGGLLPLKCNTAAHAEGDADLLCGRYRFGVGFGTLLTEAMPDVLSVCLLRAEASGPPLPGGRAVIDALGQALLGFALRVHARDGNAPAGLLPLAADPRLGPSIRAVLETTGHPWTIAELGKIVAMSRATYARHFQACAGVGVGEFLTRVRMMLACTLLKGERTNLIEVAEAVGYQSEAAFGKAFRDVVGETPGRWRRSQRIGLSSVAGFRQT